ncbi:MAG: hypothetical protein FWB88_05415 [Defluviitaleaceae bacterium]|nr:hypothetical protein [Defluviitaleaceae bacterium]MCL2240866.1 hypothetical protein [Defluviitaleaceae bacterium]
MHILSGFTPAERDACLPIVDRMAVLAKLARTEGILALEEWCNTQEKDFLTFLLMMVVDGTDPAIVEDMGETLIDADGHTGEALLSRLMLLEGVQAIQMGMHPLLLEAKLLAMLGESYLISRGYYMSGGIFNNPLNQLKHDALAKLFAQKALPQSADFNTLFTAMGNRDMQAVMRETAQTELALALKGCTAELGHRFLTNCSSRLSVLILEEMEAMPNTQEEEILFAQKRMLNIVKRMRDAGEILLCSP